jgi:phage host-nuclease inhibitor protein Gam
MATPTETTTALTAAQREEGIAKLDGMVKDAVLAAVKQINDHNADVKIVRNFSSEKKDPVLILDEIVETNPGNDPKLAKLAEDIETLKSRIEDLYKKAREIAKNYKPENVSEVEATKAHDRTKESSAKIRDAKTALKFFETLAGVDLMSLLPEVDSTRGLRLGNEGNASLGIRPVYKKMIIVSKNDKDENGNPVREEISKETEKDGVKSTTTNTTILAQTLSSRGGRGFTVTSSEITSAFLEAMKTSFDKLTAGVEYAWTFSKDVTNSDGKVIDTKSWDLVFIK